MQIKIYQIIPELDRERKLFLSLDQMGEEIPARIYEQVFSGVVEADDLEEVFCIFNLEHPDGYAGRSLSVSDVVEVLDGPVRPGCYYCDSVGFAPVPFKVQEAAYKISNHDFHPVFEERERVRMYLMTADGLCTCMGERVLLERCLINRSQLGYRLTVKLLCEDRQEQFTFPEKPELLVTSYVPEPPASLFHASCKLSAGGDSPEKEAANCLKLVHTWLELSGQEYEVI